MEILSFDDFFELCERYRRFWDEFFLKKDWRSALHFQRYFQVCPQFAVWLSQPDGRVYKTEITFASRVLAMNYRANPRLSSKWQALYRDFERFCKDIRKEVDNEISSFAQEKEKESKTL